MPSLSRHTFRVELADGSVHEVTSSNADQIAWEETRARRKWPQVTEGAVVLWWTFLAWRAASRAGVTSVDFSTWKEKECVDVDNLTADENDGAGEDVDPTP